MKKLRIAHTNEISEEERLKSIEHSAQTIGRAVFFFNSCDPDFLCTNSISYRPGTEAFFTTGPYQKFLYGWIRHSSTFYSANDHGRLYKGQAHP